MANQLKDFENMLAASLCMLPCTEDELIERFNDRYNSYFISKAVQWLENKYALYYKGDVLHIKKAWAKENLQEYDLDLRSERQKELDGMTDFAKQLKRDGFI